MNNTASRDRILAKIKQTREERSNMPLKQPEIDSPVFKAIEPSALECFKNELETVSGKCTICKTKSEMAAHIKHYLSALHIPIVFCRDSEIRKFLVDQNIAYSDKNEDFQGMQAGITSCEFLVARTGSVLVSSQGESGRQMNIFPPVHLVIANKSQIQNYVSDALDALQAKYKDTNLPSMASFVSGPSRTADIEKTLVLGAHGPKELHVFILE